MRAEAGGPIRGNGGLAQKGAFRDGEQGTGRKMRVSSKSNKAWCREGQRQADRHFLHLIFP